VRRPVPVLLAVPVLALALPSAAGADITWGSDPGSTGESVTCAGSCTVAQARSANQELAEVLYDGRGVVTRWRATVTGGQVRLRALGGAGAGDWVAPGGTVDQAVRIPVGAGQLVGLDLRDGAQVGFQAPFVPDDAEVVHQWTPALPDGGGPGGAEARRGSLALALTIEPDADGDGLGDETQDPDGGRPVPPPPPDPDPGGAGPDPDPGPGTPQPDPAPRVPKGGPRLALPRTLSATRSGVVSLTVANPYGQALRGTVTLRQGTRRVARATLALGPEGGRTVKLRLSSAARRTLARRGRLSLRVEIRAKASGTKTRASVRTATARRSSGSSGGGATGGGLDGTYRASDGQVLVIRDGVVQSFNGSLTLYCTRSKRQKLVSYSMIGDDPKPKVGGDGRFAWEATRNYGFQKLKFDGRVAGDTATGNLVVEDRSPLLGTGRFEFDYCFAGKQWSLKR
jgi:hypothetical protein